MIPGRDFLSAFNGRIDCANKTLPISVGGLNKVLALREATNFADATTDMDEYELPDYSDYIWDTQGFTSRAKGMNQVAGEPNSTHSADLEEPFQELPNKNSSLLFEPSTAIRRICPVNMLLYVGHNIIIPLKNSTERHITIKPGIIGRLTLIREQIEKPKDQPIQSISPTSQ